MKGTLILLVCALMTIAYPGAGEQCGPAEQSVAEQFLRTCYEVPDYTGIPQAIVERDYSDEISEVTDDLTDAMGVVGQFEDTQGYAFLTGRFSSLCSDAVISEMMANRILPDYYQALGVNKFNATVKDIALTQMPSSDADAARKLYGYKLTILVISSSSGAEAESILSGRIAADIVDGEELVVYMNYGTEDSPMLPQ